MVKIRIDKGRETNLEVLRIIMTLGVICLHYNNPNAGQALVYSKGINIYILYFIESLFICAVNVFILMSGFFLCETKKRSLLKPLQLITQLIFFSCISYFLEVLTKDISFSVKKAILSLIPNNYYLVLYITLYLISPYINIMLREMNVKKIRRMTILCYLLFSIWPTIVDVLSEITKKNWGGLNTIGLYGSQWGYSIVNFLLMYIIGALLKFSDTDNKKKDKKRIISLIIICALSLVLWEIVNIKFGGKSAWSYCNPLVILEAVLWFELFRSCDISNSYIINNLAKGCFTVYIMHGVFFKYLNISFFVQQHHSVMLLHICCSSILIFIVCYFMYYLYKMMVIPMQKKVFDKVPIIKKDFINLD